MNKLNELIQGNTEGGFLVSEKGYVNKMQNSQIHYIVNRTDESYKNDIGIIKLTDCKCKFYSCENSSPSIFFFY